MFVRPLGWQWAGRVQPVTMLGLSQLDTWWGLTVWSSQMVQHRRSVIPALKTPISIFFHHHTRVMSP